MMAFPDVQRLTRQVAVWLHRPLAGETKQTRLVRDAVKDTKSWKVPFILALPTPEQIAVSGGIGVDLGSKGFLTTSDNEDIPNLRFLEKQWQALKHEQRSLARQG